MARLTLAELSDKSRYQFKSQDVDLPELGGSVEVKALSVAEREALPSLLDEDGKPDASVPKLAQTFSAIVSDPQVSAKEAEGFLGDLPATAFDRVSKVFGELLEVSEEEKAAALREFQPAGD